MNSKIYIWGILNVTPDSFSDGGKFNSIESAIQRAEILLKEGADIIDVGAESTRPFASEISEQEEYNRLIEIVPEIHKLTLAYGKKLSLDSRNYSVIKSLIKYIDIINDVSGLIDDRIIEIASKENKKLAMMHSLSVPSNPNIVIDNNENVIDYLKNWMRVKIRSLSAKNFDIKNLIFDPGIGFNKTSQQSLYIIKNCAEFSNLDCEILIGHSRKSIFKCFEIGKSLEELDFYTSLMSIYMLENNIQHLRVHNVGMLNRLRTNLDMFNKIEIY